MALLFPIKIGELRFFVNPTKIDVRKRSSLGQVRTMSGTTFQVWPDFPDEITFTGMSFGTRSLVELRGLGQTIQREAQRKEVELVYKFNKYRGYIKEINIDNDADKPRQFSYKLTFISKDPFELGNMPIGQLTGLSAEFDFFTAQVRGVVGEIASLPADIADNAAKVFRQVTGKTGSAKDGLNIFIGRARKSKVSLKRIF